jgi:hypothetical protein
MMAIVNFIRAPTAAQIVLLAKVRYDAADAQVSVLFAASAAGALVLALLAGGSAADPPRQHVSWA